MVGLDTSPHPSPPTVENGSGLGGSLGTTTGWGALYGVGDDP